MNRQVSIVKGEYKRIADLAWTHKPVHKVWMKAYGFVCLSKIVLPNQNIAYFAANDLSLLECQDIKDLYACRWKIEVFHRGIQQCCGIERCYSVKAKSQRKHILCAFPAFLKPKFNRILTSISWYQQKCNTPRLALRSFLT